MKTNIIKNTFISFENEIRGWMDRLIRSTKPPHFISARDEYKTMEKQNIKQIYKLLFFNVRYI